MTISNLTKSGRKLSKGVENTVGKGEIARNEQFLLFPPCFQKTCTGDVKKKKKGLFRKGLTRTKTEQKVKIHILPMLGTRSKYV